MYVINWNTTPRTEAYCTLATFIYCRSGDPWPGTRGERSWRTRAEACPGFTKTPHPWYTKTLSRKYMACATLSYTRINTFVFFTEPTSSLIITWMPNWETLVLPTKSRSWRWVALLSQHLLLQGLRGIMLQKWHMGRFLQKQMCILMEWSVNTSKHYKFVLLSFMWLPFN